MSHRTLSDDAERVLARGKSVVGLNRLEFDEGVTAVGVVCVGTGVDGLGVLKSVATDAGSNGHGHRARLAATPVGVLVLLLQLLVVGVDYLLIRLEVRYLRLLWMETPAVVHTVWFATAIALRLRLRLITTGVGVIAASSSNEVILLLIGLLSKPGVL